MSNFDEELKALTQQIQTEPWDGFMLSPRQLGGLQNLLRAGMSNPADRNARIRILQVLVGDEVRRLIKRDISSTKDLPSVVASVLIQVLREPESKPWKLSRHGGWLIECAEQYPF